MFKPKNERDRGFIEGARAAACIAGDYDRQCTHPYALEDCILSKLNLKNGKLRKKIFLYKRVK